METQFINLMGDIFGHSRASHPVVRGSIWPQFKLIKDIMNVLVTCKLKMCRIDSNQENMETSTFRRSRAANVIVRSWA